MPIGKLIFKLPEERSDFKLAQNAWKYKSSLIDFADKLRGLYKYSDTKPESWEEVRELFYSILIENDCPDIHSDDE